MRRAAYSLVASLALTFSLGGALAQQSSTLPKTSRATFLKLTDVQEMWEESRYQDAIVELEQLIAEVSDKPYELALANQYLAHTSILIDDNPRARRAIEAALAIDGLPFQMEADLKLFYGQLLVGDEEYDEAKTTLEAWLAATEIPPTPQQIFYVAYANYMTGDLGRAQPLIERAIDEAPQPNDQWDRLYYQILFDQKRYDEAIVVILDMLDRNPAEDGYWRLLANHYMQLEESRNALAAMVIADLQNPLTEVSDLKRIVSLYGYVEIPDKAARLLEEHLDNERLPRDPDTLRQLGDLWLLAREREKAKGVLQQAAAIAPNGRTFELLGGIFFEDEQWNDAYDAYADAIESGGLDEPNRVQLLAGISAFRAGMTQEARNALEAAAESDEFRAQAESLLRKL